MSTTLQKEDLAQSLKILALDVHSRVRHWPATRALAYARGLNRSWLDIASRYSSTDGPADSTVLAIRRIATYSAIHDTWTWRYILAAVGAASGIFALAGIPLLTTSLLSPQLSGGEVAGVGVLAFILSLVAIATLAPLAHIPPFSFAPLLRRMAEIGLAIVFAWWAFRGAGNELLTSLLDQENLRADEKARALAAGHSLATSIALYVGTGATIEIIWRLSGYRSPAELLSRRVHGYLPPPHIVTETYLHLIWHIHRNRAALRKRRIKKRVVTAMRFLRAEMVLDVDRCIRSYGGSRGDRDLYRARVNVFRSRLEAHEHALLDAIAPREADAVSQAMLSDVEELCAGNWPDASDQPQPSLRNRVAAFTRRVAPALALGLLGLFYHKLPMVDSNAAGTGAIQAALVTGAIALSATSDANVEGGLTNIFGRRGRDRG
ncbi:hypothetical protein GA0070606_3523 [Micromonospora citrea]|uniref:Uncharacterized protein n=1 Tax=Micromonospora citrea TaxID=47855 RepID=A0A1C6V6C1_9ACTN|nr:hypothetical protein [Micromonospora citrea]SCL61903.1 hypothetical protein GA0070606_3523 [Micromonospora citrea]